MVPPLRVYRKSSRACKAKGYKSMPIVVYMNMCIIAIIDKIYGTTGKARIYIYIFASTSGKKGQASVDAFKGRKAVCDVV